MPESEGAPQPAAPTQDPPAAAPTLTQDEVNRLVGNARVEARTALLKKLGVDKEDDIKSIIEERDALKQSQMSEAEKALDEANKWKAKAEALEATVESAKLTLLRARIGREKGLPEPLIERLQGSDEESLNAEIDALTPFLKPAGAPAPDLGGGTVPPGAGNGTSPDEQMAQILVNALTSKGG